jgi:hypothetical protein
MTVLAETFTPPTATSVTVKTGLPAVKVLTHSLKHVGRRPVIDTPAVELTKAWNDALFGFKLDLQSQNRSEGTIRNRLCASTIMARHAVGDGLDPGDVTYPWLARYMSEQYSRRKRGGPCSLHADLRAFWMWFSTEFVTDNPIAKIRRPREVMTMSGARLPETRGPYRRIRSASLVSWPHSSQVWNWTVSVRTTIALASLLR